MPDLYYTVTRNEIRPYMPAIPVLVSAAGWTVQQPTKKDAYRLRAPPLPAHVVDRGADCGGFVATVRWGGRYRFTPRQYVGWLLHLRPRWAATIDLCCVDLGAKGALCYPGKGEVERRQQFTTDMAYHFWGHYQHLPLALCPTIQGYHPEEYVRHASVLAPLIREMHATYLETGWADEEQEQEASAFRVGVGSLCGRTPQMVHEIVEAVRAVLGYIPLHLWGTKLTFLRSPLEQESVISMDTAAWNGLWGPIREERRRSGLSEAQYCWTVSYPRYANLIQTALQQPKFPPIIDLVNLPQSLLEEAKTGQEPLPEPLCYRCSGEGPGEQRARTFSGEPAAAVKHMAVYQRP